MNKISKEEKINQFFENIKTLDEYSSLQKIYGTLYEFLLLDNNTIIQEILKKAIETELSLTNLIGFLTITKIQDKQLLTQRKLLIEKTLEKIRKECPEDENELMNDLY